MLSMVGALHFGPSDSSPFGEAPPSHLLRKQGGQPESSPWRSHGEGDRTQCGGGANGEIDEQANRSERKGVAS